MQTHTFVQGSPEWHAYRAQHFNASDAPSMLGISPYKSRTELLNEKLTGVAKEVDPATQALFDDGHRFEALARPLAEEIVGDDLYPVTGSSGKLSASFDGLTMAEDIAWEHKTLNDRIRAVTDVADLGLHYRAQMEQQLLISGAKKCLFLATRWDHQGQLQESKHFWYESDPALRAEIIAGWEQFEKDLAHYKPREIAEKPAADSIMHLPALAVQIRGEVVLSNLPAFREAAEHFIENIKTDLQTDEDFANAEATVKFCDKAEKELALTKDAAIAQTASIGELMRTIDYIKDELRGKRLMLEKLVASKKAVIKDGILAKARDAYAAHIAGLEAEIQPLRLVLDRPDFAAAAKNKRTLASLHDAVDSELARAKIAADSAAKAIRAKLAWYREQAAEFEFLFRDLQQVIQKADDDFRLLVTSRISEHKAAEAKRLEDERKRIEEQERARAEAAVRAEQEAAAAAERARQAPAAPAVLPQRTATVAAPVEKPLSVSTEPADSDAVRHFRDIVMELLDTHTTDEVRYLLEETLAKVGLSAWAPA